MDVYADTGAGLLYCTALLCTIMVLTQYRSNIIVAQRRRIAPVGDNRHAPSTVIQGRRWTVIHHCSVLVFAWQQRETGAGTALKHSCRISLRTDTDRKVYQAGSNS